MVPGRATQHPLAALRAGESVYLLDPREETPWTIHCVYGHPVTCLDTSDCCVAFGVKRSGWAMHDGGNKVCSVFRCGEYLAVKVDLETCVLKVAVVFVLDVKRQSKNRPRPS